MLLHISPLLTMSKRIRPSWYRESPPKQPPFAFEPEEEDDVVILPQVDNSALLARLHLSLVGRMFHQGGRSTKALLSFLPKENIWDVEGRVRGVSLGDARFQFFFESEVDLQKVLNKRPCHFNKWSFALERWEPHVGTSFPNIMTFWVRTEGIPAEFWDEEVLRNFGNSLGLVRRVDPSKGRILISVTADVPLRFNKNAQLPSGTVVKVKLSYEKLFRWCSYCRRICHELEQCPLLDAEQKAVLSAEESQRNLRLSLRDGDSSQARLPLQSFPESNRSRSERNHLPLLNGPPSSRPYHSRGVIRREENNLASRSGRNRSHRQPYPASLNQYPAEHASKLNRPHGAVSHKRPASPVVTRNAGVDDGRKRRFGDSFSKEKSSAPPNKQSSPLLSDSQLTLSDTVLAPSRAKQITSSPTYVRERPFRLNLSKKASALEKGKGKVVEHPTPLLGESSVVGSSAKKSLNFEPSEPAPKNLDTPISVTSKSLEPQLEKRKSWYDMTVEEDEATARSLESGPDTILAAKFSQVVSFASPSVVSPSLSVLPSPAAPEDEWNESLNPLSEALNLDWTEEDEAAYHLADDLDVDADDLLSEELQESLQDQSGLVIPGSHVAPISELQPEKLKSLIVSSLQSEEVGPSIAIPRRKDSKKKVVPHSRKAQLNSGLCLNLASKKIHHI